MSHVVKLYVTKIRTEFHEFKLKKSM